MKKEGPPSPANEPLVERLWTPNEPRKKYTFSISASREDLLRILNRVREHASPSTDPREIEEFLIGTNNQLNFGVYRFYLDPKENVVFALINGGASNPHLNETYGPKLADLLDVSKEGNES